MSIQANFPNLKPTLLLDFANTKQLDNRVTFTRSTPAVYYDGKTTAMAEQNLFSGSQDFRTASGWSVQSGGQSVTTDSVTAPDGTTTADTLIEPSSGSNVPRWYQIKTVTANTPYTVSCYLKANTRTFGYVQMEILSVGNIIQYFNLSTGATSTLTNTGNTLNVSATITSVGSGWYRCTLTASFGSGTSMYAFIGLADSTPNQSYTTNGSSLYAWGAQLEQRASATAYTVTTTQAITNYIPVLLTAGGNQPRFDCNPTTGESLGFLIEEQRTNLFTYSSQFDDSGWSKSASTVTANTVIAPDGTLSGDTLIEDATNAQHFISKVGSIQSGSVTLSIYAKAAGRDWIRIQTYSGVMAWFNISTGVLGTVQSGCTATITSVGNGWYRCAATVTYVNQTNYVFLANADGVTSYTGNGFSGVHIWGAQLEAGSFATSYIATTSASATRTTDLAIMDGANFNSWYNRAQGTLYANIVYIGGITGTPQETNSIWIDDTTASNRIALRTVRDPSSAQTDVTIASGGSINLDSGGYGPVTTGVTYKQGVSYTTTTASHFVNMVSDITNAVCIAPLNTSRLAINGAQSGAFYLNKLSYYPASTTVTQLQALTS